MSKHHYARKLALNNKVWFVEPPSGNLKVESVQVDQQLFLIRYKPVLKGKNRLPKRLSRWLHGIEIGRILSLVGKPDIVWSFDPYRFQWLSDFGAEKLIYHPVDLHPNAKRVHILCQNVDFIFSTSDSILQSISPVNAKTRKISHGLHVAPSGSAFGSIPGMPGNNPVKACYVGNFYRALNVELFYELCRRNNDTDFLFIGPTQTSNLGSLNYEHASLKKLKDLENTWFIGEVSPDLINSYLKRVDINIVAYNKPELNPHKILSYLYSGKVTLTTCLYEYRHSDLLITAKDDNEYLMLFENIKGNLDFYNSDAKQKERVDFALKHTYEKIIDQLSEIIYGPAAD